MLLVYGRDDVDAVKEDFVPQNTRTGRQASNGATPEAVEPTPASEWKKGDVYKLPSGKNARLHRPGLMAMLARGQIPNPLADKVASLITHTTEDELKARTREQREEAMRENIEAFTGIAVLCFQEPRLVVDREPDYEHGEIGASDLSNRDLFWLFYEFVEGSAADVAEFLISKRS